MAHSLEVRVPFLGKSHREASSKLPMYWRLPNNMEEKAALRAAAALTNLPKDIVRPTIVAGINALGRGQDRESLTQFIGTIAQTLGPEALMKFVEPLEAIKRLAAAQGIDVLNLIKTQEQIDGEMQAQMQAQQQQSLVQQAGKLAGTPMMDPSKNPAMEAAMQEGMAEEPPIEE